MNIGELGHPVNGQKHIELALGQTQLGNVNVHVADFSRPKLAPPGRFNLARWQPRNAMPEQASMQALAAELRDALAQTAHHVIQGQQRCSPELHDYGLLGR